MAALTHAACATCENEVFPEVVLIRDKIDLEKYLREYLAEWIERTCAVMFIHSATNKRNAKRKIELSTVFRVLSAKPSKPAKKAKKWFTQIFSGGCRYVGYIDYDFCMYDLWPNNYDVVLQRV